MNSSKRGNRFARLATGVTVVVSAALLVVFFARKSPSEKLSRAADFQPWRPIEGRLTGFDYTPCPNPPQNASLLRMQCVAPSITTTVRPGSHKFAVATLLDGKPARATAALEALLSRDPKNTDLWSDLAVARLADGTGAADARSLALSLVAADHALSLEPTHVAALFNRAIALGALGLRFAATDAWRRYLAVDPGSAWAVEARERLVASDVPTRDEQWKHDEAALENALDRAETGEIERIITRFPLQARMAAESKYLPSWASGVLAGDTLLAQKQLTRARLIGTALEKQNGDTLLPRVIAKLREDSAQAFRAYGLGRQDNVGRKIKESLDEFTEAERGFAASDNPMELSAAYWRANALVDLRRQQESEALAAELEPRLDPSYRSLRAHVMWLRVRHAAAKGRHYESLLVTRAAREIFEQLGEIEYAMRLRSAEAEMLRWLGRDHEAWQCRRIALAGAAESGRWNIVETAIEAIAGEEAAGSEPAIARSLLNVQIAAPSVLPLTRFNALLWRAFLDTRSNGGVPDMAPARNAMARIRDAKQREDAEDGLQLAEGLAIAERDPARAERLFSDVMDSETHVGLISTLPSIYLHRARVRRTMSKFAEAESDLHHAIELIEARRERIPDDTLRDAFLGRSEDAYEELGDLMLERGEWMDAFEISERLRARVLLDKAGRKPMRLAEIAASVPAAVTGVHYTTFPDRTLLVVIEHGRTTHHVIHVKRSEIAALRDRLSSNPASEADARRLYNLLIAPLADRVVAGRLLIIAPDEMTYAIPFAALRAPNGQFLIEQTAIAIAPAATAMASEVPTLLPNQSTVAIVADPAFSASSFPTLEHLPAARGETAALRPIFGSTIALAGESATRRALESAGRNCDVLHIAAHAFSSTRDSSLSLIALTPEPGDEGILYLEDVKSLELRGRPLVVLAGCQTGSFGKGNGSIRSLAHAFLAAGSRAVLATLWNVEDKPASELTRRFYRSLQTGTSMPQALRDAQLAAIHSRPPSEWSAFQLYLGVKSNARAVSH